VADQTTPKIGTILDGSEGKDAVHIAVAPVRSEDVVSPGQHVAMNGTAWVTADIQTYKAVGIVDPFLTGPVEIGERFFVFLYPGTITGLRHVWTHPEFETKVPGKDGRDDG
jgi:hypothetical protein